MEGWGVRVMNVGEMRSNLMDPSVAREGRRAEGCSFLNCIVVENFYLHSVVKSG